MLHKKYINPKTGKKYSYYSRDGKGYENVLDWAKDIEPPRSGVPSRYKNPEEYMKYKVVKQETTWMGFWVSTVWLGLDHEYSGKHDPLIFESMVFFRGMSDLDMDRYTTEAQAKAGHKEMMQKWSNPLTVIVWFIDRKSWPIQWWYRRQQLKLKKLLIDMNTRLEAWVQKKKGGVKNEK